MAIGTVPLSMPWIHRKILEPAERATAHQSLLGAAHSVVVRGSCNVVLPFTHAPSLFPLFPTRSFQNRELGDRQPSEPGDRRPDITQTVAEERQENQTSPNVVGKNHAPNPLKSPKTKTKSETVGSTHEKKRR